MITADMFAEKVYKHLESLKMGSDDFDVAITVGVELYRKYVSAAERDDSDYLPLHKSLVAWMVEFGMTPKSLGKLGKPEEEDKTVKFPRRAI